jgi:glycolate oxidase FAD binding subunit
MITRGSTIAEQVRAAAAAETPLRIHGAGTWMDAGRPVVEASSLSLAGDRGIVEYVPGDLTLTARAGTPLSEIVTAVKANGQWLPLDPWGGDDGTLGATLATATAGPHAYAMGLPRDVVLGMEFVNGIGETVRAGGRVVKNVAGFDLTRLLVGSWGTLGVITEVTVRLRARPEQTRTFAIDVTASREGLNALAASLRALPFSPLASELVNAALAFQLGCGEGTTLFVRLGGNQRALAGQLDLVRKLGETREFEERVWPALRSAEPKGASTWRWSQLPTHFGNSWSTAERVTRELEGAFIHGNPARGVVRIIATSHPDRHASMAASFDGTVSVERLPRDAFDRAPARHPSDDLIRTIRAKFDPRGILNPGIIGAAA